MQVQVPHVAASVTAVIAVVCLLAAGSPGLLCGVLQVEGEQGRQGSSSHTWGGEGGGHTGGGLGGHTGRGVGDGHGAFTELDPGVVLELSC